MFDLGRCASCLEREAEIGKPVVNHCVEECVVVDVWVTWLCTGSVTYLLDLVANDILRNSFLVDLGGLGGGEFTSDSDGGW